MSDFSFYLVTDPHYFDESFGRSGSAYEARSRTDQKCVAETPAILDAGFAQIAADRETRVILIPGDLVYRGEYQSHVGFRKRLYRLQEAGKKIYLITARHDYAENPCEFIGDHTVPVAGMERSDLRDFYREFGFDDAIAEHRESMSYVAQLAPGLRLLALNCDGDCKDFKGLWPEQLDWAVAQIQAAHAAGERIIAMTHYPLLPFSAVMGLIGDAHLTDWEQTANTLADAGLELIFTGHMHAQAVTEHISPAGNTITDVQTGCFVGCPCAYRKVTVAPDGQVDIRSYTIDDFDYDKGGRTAAEYLQWRFDRMITDIMDAMATDFDAFMGKFGGSQGKEKLKGPVTAVGKLLQKLTVKQLGRLFWFRVDPSIGDRRVADVGVELVRNIFMGNEPYVPGTPMYDALDHLLRRLSPVLHILEKKLSAGNPQLSDLRAFVLSMIGDKKQRDHNCTLQLTK